MIHSSEETAASTDVKTTGEDLEFPPPPAAEGMPNVQRVQSTELTDKPLLQVEEEEKEEKVSEQSRSTELSSGEISTPPSGSSPETLAALIKADRRVILMNEARKAAYYDATAKPRTASVVMQILSCGSVAVRECEPPCKAKSHGFSLISHQKMITMLPCGTSRNNQADVVENAAMELPLIASVFRSL